MTSKWPFCVFCALQVNERGPKELEKRQKRVTALQEALSNGINTEIDLQRLQVGRNDLVGNLHDVPEIVYRQSVCHRSSRQQTPAKLNLSRISLAYIHRVHRAIAVLHLAYIHRAIFRIRRHRPPFSPLQGQANSLHAQIGEIQERRTAADKARQGDKSFLQLRQAQQVSGGRCEDYVGGAML